MTIGEEIKRLRKEKGLTTTQLGSLTGFTQGFISHIENGFKRPTNETASLIFEALGMSKLYALKQLGLLDETDILALIDENKRLRNALEEIENGFYHLTSFEVMKITSKALKGGSNDDRRNL